MEFKEIDKINLAQNTYKKPKNKNLPVKNEEKVKNENLKDVPNNPSYWQSLIDVKSNIVSANNDVPQSNADSSKTVANGSKKSEAILEEEKLQKIKELTERSIEPECIENLLALDEAQFEKALVLADKGVNSSYILELTLLNDNQYENSLILADKGVSSTYIKEIAELNETQFKSAIQLLDKNIFCREVKEIASDEKMCSNALKLLDKGVSAWNIKHFATLDDKQFEKVLLLADKKINSDCIKKITNLGEKQFERVIKLADKGADSASIEKIISLNENEIERAIILLEKGLNSYYIQQITKLNDNQFEKALILIDKGVSQSNIREIAELDDAQFEKALILKNKGIFSDYLPEMSKLDEKQFERALILSDKGIKENYIQEIAELEEKQFENALKLAEKGVDSRYIKSISALNEAQLEKAIKLAGKNFPQTRIEEVALLDDTQFERALVLAEKGVRSHIKEIALLDEPKYKKALNLLDKHFYSGSIIDIVELDDTQYKKALNLFDKGIESDCIIGILKLDEEHYENALNLFEAGISSNYLKNFAELDDTQYEKVMNLATRGVDSGYIKNIINLSEAEYEKAVKLIDVGLDIPTIEYFIDLNEKEFERTLQLLYKGVEVECIENFLDLNEVQYEKTLKYLDMGINEYSSITLVEQGIDLFSQMNLVKVSKHAQTDMFKNFFANNSKTDEIIKNTDFSQYGKDGIPLEYPRTEFLDDLSSELAKLPDKTQEEIIEKLGIYLIQDEDGSITGYDGIIDLTKLSSDGEEGKVLELANNFILNNKVVTGDGEVDNALNSLISGMPEFINTIGKQQHDTHSYSLDVHILETYKAAISDSDYKNLSNHQKFELKLMTILHDISKQEVSIDNEHPLISAKYAKDILSRYSLSDSTKYEVANNILNHHWGRDYNIKSVPTEETAVKMGTVSNYNLQKIFAKADLTGMGNPEFSDDKLEGLTDSAQANLVVTLNKVKSTTPLVYTTPIIKPDLIPSQKIKLPDGTTKKIKSINLAELPDDYDMEKLGFMPKTKAKDVTLGVHTADSMSQFDLFEMLTADPISSSPQSVSIISKNDNSMFKRFGVAVELKASDVINATHYDQGSGVGKTEKQLVKLTTGRGAYKSWRETLPNKIRKTLNLSASEYSELASIVENYKHLSQLGDTKEITVGEKTFTGKEIKTAISLAQAELMQMVKEDITELVVKKAKVLQNTYVLRYDCADDINNKKISTFARKALIDFLSDIPNNSIVIFAGYDGYLYSSFPNQWESNKKIKTENDS